MVLAGSQLQRPLWPAVTQASGPASGSARLETVPRIEGNVAVLAWMAEHLSSLLKRTRPAAGEGRQCVSWSMGNLPGGDHGLVEVVHRRRPLPVTCARWWSWRLCATGQVGPVVHRGAGKARRFSFCRAGVGEGLLVRGGGLSGSFVSAGSGFGGTGRA